MRRLLVASLLVVACSSPTPAPSPTPSPALTRAEGFVTAEDVAAHVESRENLVVGEREEVTIGGLTGIRLVADTTDSANSDPVMFRTVLDAPPWPISIGSGRRLEINLFTISDGVLAILVGGSIAQWDRALELSQPVLESVIVSV